MGGGGGEGLGPEGFLAKLSSCFVNDAYLDVQNDPHFFSKECKRKDFFTVFYFSRKTQ